MTIILLPVRRSQTQLDLEAGRYDAGKLEQVKALADEGRWSAALLHSHTIRDAVRRAEGLAYIEERRHKTHVLPDAPGTTESDESSDGMKR